MIARSLFGGASDSGRKRPVWRHVVYLFLAAVMAWLLCLPCFLPQQATFAGGMAQLGDVACPATRFYEMETASVTYTPPADWSTLYNPSDSGGALRASNKKDSTASLNISGTSFDLLVRKDWQGGSATVKIDGASEKTIGFENPLGTEYRVRENVNNWLSTGVHTVTIEVLLPSPQPYAYLDGYYVGDPALGYADPYEIDNTYLDATEGMLGMLMLNRRTDWAADEDWTLFQGKAGEVFTITTFNLYSGTDTVMMLYDISRTKLAESDDVNPPSDLSSQIVYTPTTTSHFYVMVGPKTGTASDKDSCKNYYSMSLGAEGDSIKSFLPFILFAGEPVGVLSRVAALFWGQEFPAARVEPSTAPALAASTPVGPGAALEVARVPVGKEPGDIALAFREGLLFVANYGADSVSVVDLEENRVIAAIEGVPSPAGLAYDAYNRTLWASNAEEGTVTPVHIGEGGGSFALLPAVSVGNDPHGVGYNPYSGLLYVANRGDDTVTVIDGAERAVVKTISGYFSRPSRVVVNPEDGKTYVTNAAGRSVTAIGLFDDEPVNLPVSFSGPYGIGIDPDRYLVYVASGDGISVLRADSGYETASISFRGRGGGAMSAENVVVNPYAHPDGGGYLWLSTSSVGGDDRPHLVTTGGEGSPSKMAIYAVGPDAHAGMAADPRTGRIYVSNRADGSISVWEVEAATDLQGRALDLNTEGFFEMTKK